MQELSTSTAIPTNAIKTEALASMSASFERFCLVSVREVCESFESVTEAGLIGRNHV